MVYLYVMAQSLPILISMCFRWFNQQLTFLHTQLLKRQHISVLNCNYSPFLNFHNHLFLHNVLWNKFTLGTYLHDTDVSVKGQSMSQYFSIYNIDLMSVENSSTGWVVDWRSCQSEIYSIYASCIQYFQQETHWELAIDLFMSSKFAVFWIFLSCLASRAQKHESGFTVTADAADSSHASGAVHNRKSIWYRENK